jgi:glutamate-1-semialdehyde 2,1-aminomutase
MAQHRAPVLNLRTAAAADGTPTYERLMSEAVERRGGWVRDADGRARADFCNAYGSVVLGWSDPDVEAAVAAEPCSGRAAAVVERIAAMMPSAEAVALRSGVPAALMDALTAARAATGRDGAFFCDDRSIVSSDISAVREALERHDGKVAALVVEPLDAEIEFLEGLRGLADRHGAVLVFDESKSALRVHEGGVQASLGVTPDVSVLGSSIANGRPLAAVVGRIDILRAIAAESSGWPVAEAALAAADVTLEKVERLGVVAALGVIGAEIAAEVERMLMDHGADHLFEVCGDPAWSVMGARASAPADPETLKACLAAALYEQGVVSFGSHIPSFSIGDAEITRLLHAYDAALPIVVSRVESGAFDRRGRSGRRATR